MAAKKKRAAKKKPPMKDPGVGHNSDHAAQQAELLKIAKAQRSLDKKKAEFRAEVKAEHDKLTGRLKEAGISRQAFRQPYENYCRLADADNDDDARKAREDNKVYLAQQRLCYDALGHGETVDWIDLIQDADAIQKAREQAEAAAAEEAAENGPDAENVEAGGDEE